jgi:predicted porin
MKKSLFAIAAVTAFAGAAQAQSSVTVYGILDVGVAGGNTRSANNANGFAANNVITKTGVGIANGAESTNRIGFKGSEDLGGGMSAFFTVEQSIDVNAASIVNANGNRQTFAGLKKNGIGSISAGTQYTPIHEAAAATDAAGLNNMAGNIIYPNSTGPVTGKISATTASINALGALDNNASYVVRQSNSLVLKTENFAGFTARGMVVANSSNQTQTSSLTGGASNKQGYALGLDFVWNKLYLTANAQTFKAYGPSTNATTAPTLFGVQGTDQAGSNVNDAGQYYAATYDFGILKAYVQYVNRKASNAYDTSYYQTYQAQQIGVRAPITSTISAFASAGTGKYAAYGQGLPKSNLNAMQLGADYYLSKRTNLYAIYGQTAVSNAALTVAGTTGQNSANINNYAVGVRHTF